MKILKHPFTKILISTVLFGVIFSQIDAKEVFANIKLLNPVYIPLILLFLILNYLISAIRWKKLLIFDNHQNVSTPYLAKLYFVGAFFNNFMPTSMGGDVYKIYKLGGKISSKTNAFSATFMERFTGFAALIVISYFGLIETWDFLFSLLPATLSQNNVIVGMLKFLVIFGFWIGTVFAFYVLKGISNKSVKIKGLYDSLLLYKGKNGVLFVAILTSFIVQFLAIFTQYFVFIAFGVEVSLAYSLFVFPIITLASFFVPSINGVGIQDILYVQFLSVVGIVPAVAISASLIYHLFRLFVSLIGGAFYVTEKDKH